MTIAHAHATGRLDSSLLDKTAQANLEQIDFGGSSTPSLFDTHACRVVRVSDYIISLRGIISKQIIDFFFPFSSKNFSSFFLSCLVSHISCTITPHTTIPCHMTQLSIAPYRRQTRRDMHACIYPVGRYLFDPRPLLYRIYNILSIYISTITTTHTFLTSLVYRPCVFWFSFPLEDCITCTRWLTYLEVSPRRPNQLLWDT